MRRQRAGEKQRADGDRLTGDRARGDGVEAIRPEPQLERIREHESDGDGEQPPAGLQELEVAGEANPKHAGAPERAGEQGGEIGTQAARTGKAQAQTDVEEDAVHQRDAGGALPCGCRAGR